MRICISPFRYLILFIFILAAGTVAAQEHETFANRYNALHITMDKGLASNYIDDLYTDSDGFLWIAMGGGGLSRYDGYEFVTFTPDTPHRKLRSNFISKVCEDRFHRLWVASEGGIDIIDLNTMTSGIPPRLASALAPLINLPTHIITTDATGCIWADCKGGLYRISFKTDGDIDTIDSLTHPGLGKNRCSFKDVERNGSIYIGLEGQICRVVSNGKGKLQVQSIAECLKLDEKALFSDFIVKENEVWISSNQGLYRYNKSSHTVKHYMHTPGDPHSLSQNFLTALAVNEERQLIVSSLCGLNVYNPLKDNFEQIRSDIPGQVSPLLNSNFVNCMVPDGKHIWIGTESGGINKLTPKRLSLHNYIHSQEDSWSISRNPVNAIYEDPDGTLWVGTVEGGLNRKEKSGDRFTHYTAENGSLTHNSVSAITADTEGRLWVGTWGGGINLLNRHDPRKPLKIIVQNAETPYPISFIGSLTFDTRNHGVWIGSNEGLYFYDLQQEKVTSPLPDSIARNIQGCIGSIIDRQSQLWIGCMEGAYVIDLQKGRLPDGTFSYRHLKYKLDQPESGLIEKISCFHESPDGALWLGSNGYGLYRRDLSAEGEETFTAFTTRNGLPNNSIRSILEDGRGDLWIATDNGLACFFPDKAFATSYNRQDGLYNNQFYWNAAYATTDGHLYFGHTQGMVAIDPTNSYGHQRSVHAPIRFTALWADNVRIEPGNKLLVNDITHTTHIRLHERLKSFALEFAALDYMQNHTAVYSYRLLGFDKKWMTVSANRRYARYTNIPPGDYTLQVKYASSPGLEGTEIAELHIHVEPYFYKTTWFSLTLFIVLIIAVWQLYQWRIRNLKRHSEMLHREVELRTRELNEQKRLLEQQKQLLEVKTEELERQNKLLTEQNEKISRQKSQLAELARKVQALTLDKIAFFTNITHEFRTPITLIIGPIERALKLSYNPQVIEQLHFVERNSKYLLSLVNQLMDFRKVESGKLEIVNAPGDFNKFINDLVAPFAIVARDRSIDLKCYYRLPSSRFCFDEEAMHKVLTNLLSNALKFTPNEGTISLFITALPSPDTSSGHRLYISVSDTGNGIPEEDLPKVFGRFYQSKGQLKYPMYGQSGSGIGLYLCKRIVQAMNGEITVKNNRTKGCTFRLLLPLSLEESGSYATENEEISPSGTVPSAPIGHDEGKRKRIRILVVEDNADMRHFISSILRDRYSLVEADGGEEALKILNEQHIDFIISDLMMPGMDGIELSRRVKENFAISHIPFLMLTAKTSQEARIESYRVGVDEYLLKPFDETLLRTRIENILENRHRYQQRFTSNMRVENLQIDEHSADRKFMDKVMEVLQANYKNPLFDVSDFCEAMGISKTQLNQKLQNLVGQATGQFIRSYRLNQAHEMLQAHKGNKQMTVAEIAYEVGFNDPKYFTRCFTKEFQINPSKMLE